MKNSTTKNFLLSIKGKNVIKKTFSLIKKNQALKLIKYNKKLLQKLNIEIKDFINIQQIIIELTPFNNAGGKFVNLLINEDNYHIYFNDNREEKKQYSIDTFLNVKKIKIV